MSWIGKDALEKKPELTKEEAGRALDRACRQILKNLPVFTNHFQKAYSENGFYAPAEMRTGRRAFGPGRYGWLMSTREMRRLSVRESSRWKAF